ncbi:MAG TPA: hypothetical protein ENG28_00240 [Deltaproteobacteria bacterium]|nr:hypothetical protein [Deltaproteobacteria bacterium]
MRVNTDVSSLISITKDVGKKADKLNKSSSEKQDKIYDKVKVENRDASNTQVDGVDKAKEILSSIVDQLPSNNQDLHSLDAHRLLGLFH